MRFGDLAFLVISNLRRMKLRLALTSLGVVIGTAAIVLMMSLGIGLRNNMTAQLGDLGAATHINVMSGFSPTGTEEALELNDRAIERFGAMENVEAVLPSVSVMSLQGIRYKRYETYTSVQGVPMDDFAKFGYQLAEGRLPRTDKEILLGATIPASFSATGGGQSVPKLDLVGKRIIATLVEYPDEQEMKAGASGDPTESTVRLTVVGVLEPADMQTDSLAFVPISAALNFNDQDRRQLAYESVVVKAQSADAVSGIEKILTDEGYFTYSARQVQESVSATFLIIQGVLGALGAIAMLVAAIGIANTMTMSIYERTREIGIMKAVGASNRQIKRVFLGEAAIIGVLGGVGGLIFSISGAALANLYVQSMIASSAGSGAGTGSPAPTAFFSIPASLAVFAVAFAAGVGLLSGVLPAVRAANLDPLIALRHE